MAKVAALLAAVLAAAAPVGCGGDGGAEPGARERATLLLDFEPNAVHAGIVAGVEAGAFGGVDLELRPPSDATDAPRLLAAGRADFAIVEIHDLAIARGRGAEIVGVAPIVDRPLASVLVREGGPIERPRDLEGRRAGVAGLPSDEAVLDALVTADGGDPEQVRRIVIGFGAVQSLATGRVDAATGFWNAEAVALEARGVAVRSFRVDDFGAPRFPQLVVATSEGTLRDRPDLVRQVVGGLREGGRIAAEEPERALDALTARFRDLDRDLQASALEALGGSVAPGPLDPDALEEWGRWAVGHGALESEPGPDAFAFGLGEHG